MTKDIVLADFHGSTSDTGLRSSEKQIFGILENYF